MALLDPIFSLILDQLKAGKSFSSITSLLDLPQPPLPISSPTALHAWYRKCVGASRHKLTNIDSLDDAIAALTKAQRIMLLVGAGISVSCGVPDFRSGDGLYAALRRTNALQTIGDPQEVFNFDVFRDEPEIFYSIARLLYPFDETTDALTKDAGAAAGSASAMVASSSSLSERREQSNALSNTAVFTPSLTHRFLAALAGAGKLLRVYTQNIDGLEAASGVPADRLVQCHGSLSTVTCLSCRFRRPASDPLFRHAVIGGFVARCDKGGCGGLLKPDAVFFNEPLPQEFESRIQSDLSEADCLLVIGTSCKVKPVSGIPAALQRVQPGVPALLVNLEPLPQQGLDVELLGACDVVTEHLWHALSLPGLAPALAATGLAKVVPHWMWPKPPILVEPIDSDDEHEGCYECSASQFAASASVAQSGDSAFSGSGATASSSGAAASSSVATGSRGSSSGTAADSSASSARSGLPSEGVDIAVVHESPARYRFSCPRHERVAASTTARMRARMDALLSAVSASAGACEGQGPTSSRSGRAIKKPRR